MREVRISWYTDDGEENTWTKEFDDEEIVVFMRQIEDDDFELVER